MSEKEEVQKFCDKINKEGLALTINYHSYADLARGVREIGGHIYDGLRVIHNIEKFLDEHTFCDACGKRIYKDWSGK